MTIDEIRTQALQPTAYQRELLAVELFGSLPSPDNQAEIELPSRRFPGELFAGFCAKITAKGDFLWDR